MGSPLLLIPAGKVTCSSSSGLEQGMAQVPLAWDSPLPVFWEEWVRGQPCHSALLHHLQQPKGPGMGSAVPGVWPQSTRSPCACAPQHTCIQEWVGTHVCTDGRAHTSGRDWGQLCALTRKPAVPAGSRRALFLPSTGTAGPSGRECQERCQGGHLPAGWPSEVTQAPVPLASPETCQEPWGSP